MRWILSGAVMLAGCTAGTLSPPGGTATGGGLVAECRMLEAAQAATVARGQVALPDVLVGCPGHEALRETQTMRAQTAALRTANAAVLPSAVRAAGPRGELVYRRMITRGVPEPVAAGIAESGLFRAAAGGRG